MIPLQSEKRILWQRNDLFIKLLVFFFCFWIVLGHLFPIAHAAETSTDYGIVTVRETWQNITVKSGYMLGLYTKDDRVITTNLLSNNPDYGVKIALNDSTSNLRLYINGRTISYNSGEITLSASTLSGFEKTDTPIYISSDSTISSTYHICSYGSFTVVKVEEEDPSWLESVGNWFSGLGDGISNITSGLGDLFGSYLDLLKDFLSSLFRPFTSFFEAISEMFSQFGSIADLWDKFKDYTIAPVLEFFENLNNSALSYFSQLWDFPVIKELVIATVAVLLIGGAFMLFVTL